MKVNSLSLIFGFVSAVLATNPYQYTSLDIAQYSCDAWITNHDPVCLAPTVWGGHNYDCYCNSNPAFGTIMDCFINGYGNNTKIINDFAQICNMTFESMYIKYQLTLNFNSTLFRNISLGGLSKRWGKLTEDQLAKNPVLYNYNNGSFEVYRKSYDMYYLNTNRSIVYGGILLGYWGVVLLLAIIVNLVLKMYLGCMINAFIGNFVNGYRRRIGLAPTFTQSKSKEFSYLGGFISGLIPSRLETIVIGGFLITTTVLCAVHIQHIPGNPKAPTLHEELSGLIATRTSILTGYLVPLLILFAGRNNFLQWLTGWKYSTFMMYHRWISRVVLALVFTHGVTYTIVDKANGTYATNMKTNNVIWGIVACVCGGFIFFLGMLFFRRNYYEFFYVSHLLLVVFFVVGAVRHTDPIGYANYYWASIGVWVFDRVMRLLKVFSFGIRKAEITLLADETIRVVVPKPKKWKSRAGGHAFVHFLTPTKFWQSHPFSFVTTESDKVIFYVKVKKGITKELYDKLNKCPGKASTIRVIVEGPYGEHSPGQRCRNLVYVGGGNGIPGLYSECLDLDKTAPENKTIKLVWVIRNWKSVTWFVDELKRLQGTRIQTSVFITKPEDLSGLEYFNKSSSSSSLKKNPYDYEKESLEKVDVKSVDLSIYSYPSSIIEQLKAELPHVEFVEGKPSMDALVGYETGIADMSIGFITCGHPVMVDELRVAVAKHLSNTKFRVDFFEQLQNWS
ncbi:hypothetical protein G210_2679 [Candida maltosa Xu316]|uniref:FAD-binding FR-type domain-containing protein n=1 Tax=Candida maltosa (strain Xu316) TaxID=1245528 RepID=M3HI94_CANMX|nr:hypothetical protein G210_2679 [Candida maltosa Xu316]